MKIKPPWDVPFSGPSLLLGFINGAMQGTIGIGLAAFIVYWWNGWAWPV